MFPPAAERLYRHARREALIVASVWLLALCWVVGYCYLRGYDHAPDSWVVRAGLAPAERPAEQGPVAGFPGWVLWGIMLPWLGCTAFTVLFGLYGMTDDDLGADAGEEGRAARGH